MLKPLIFAAAMLVTTGYASADSVTRFEAFISVDTAALNDPAQAEQALSEIRTQAIQACRYEANSVLARQYDKACAEDLVKQTVSRVNVAALDDAFTQSLIAKS